MIHTPEEMAMRVMQTVTLIPADEDTLVVLAGCIEYLLYINADTKAEALEVLDNMFHDMRHGIAEAFDELPKGRSQ